MNSYFTFDFGSKCDIQMFNMTFMTKVKFFLWSGTISENNLFVKSLGHFRNLAVDLLLFKLLLIIL